MPEARSVLNTVKGRKLAEARTTIRQAPVITFPTHISPKNARSETKNREIISLLVSYYSHCEH